MKTFRTGALLALAVLLTLSRAALNPGQVTSPLTAAVLSTRQDTLSNIATFLSDNTHIVSAHNPAFRGCDAVLDFGGTDSVDVTGSWSYVTSSVTVEAWVRLTDATSAQEAGIIGNLNSMDATPFQSLALPAPFLRFNPPLSNLAGTNTPALVLGNTLVDSSWQVPDDFTLELYINPDNAHTGNAAGIVSCLSNTAEAGWGFSILNGDIVFELWTTTTTKTTVSAPLVLDGSWKHVAVTFNSNTGLTTLYIDQTQVDVSSTGNGFPVYGASAPRLYLDAAKVSSGSEYRYSGSMAEVRLWNATLSALELDQALNPASGFPGDLRRYWPLSGGDVGSDSLLADRVQDIAITYTPSGTLSSASGQFGGRGSGFGFVDLGADAVSTGSNAVRFAWSAGFSSPLIGSNSIVTTVPRNRWTHLAGVITSTSSSSTATLYVNGEVAGTRTALAPLTHDGLVPFRMGRLLSADNTLDDVFTGQMSQVRVWNVARSQSQIISGLTGVSGSSSGLLVSYDIDPGHAAGTAQDATSNSRDASLSGDVTLLKNSICDLPAAPDVVVVADGSHIMTTSDPYHLWLNNLVVSTPLKVITEGSGSFYAIETANYFTGSVSDITDPVAEPDIGPFARVDVTADHLVLGEYLDTGGLWYYVRDRNYRHLSYTGSSNNILEVFGERVFDDGSTSTLIPADIAGYPAALSSDTRVVVLGSHWGASVLDLSQAQVVLNALRYDGCNTGSYLARSPLSLTCTTCPVSTSRSGWSSTSTCTCSSPSNSETFGGNTAIIETLEFQAEVGGLLSQPNGFILAPADGTQWWQVPSFTVEMDINPDWATVEQFSCIMGSIFDPNTPGPGEVETGWCLGISGANTASRELFFALETSGEVGTSMITERLFASITAEETAATWFHVAATYDQPSSTARLYVNGGQVAINTGFTGSPVYDSVHPLRLGAYVDDDSAREYAGSVRDIRFWSEALDVADLADPNPLSSSNDLIGYWVPQTGSQPVFPLRRVVDLSGLGHHGVIDPGKLAVQTTSGNARTAFLTFDAAAGPSAANPGGLIVPGGWWTSLTSFTAEAYVRVDWSQSHPGACLISGGLVDDGSGLSEDEGGWCIGVRSSPPELFFVAETNGRDNQPLFNDELTFDASSYHSWFHVAATFSGSTARLYVDREEVASTSSYTGGLKYDGLAAFRLGAYEDNVGVLFEVTADMRDIRVWNSSLAADEIGLVDLSTLSGLQARYAALEEPLFPAETVVDESGNARDITITVDQAAAKAPADIDLGAVSFLAQPAPSLGNPLGLSVAAGTEDWWQSSSVSAEAWVRADFSRSHDGACVIGGFFDNTVTAEESGWCLGLSNDAGNEWFWAVETDGRALVPVMNDALFAAASDNEWTHIAGTYDGGSGISRLYVNGALVGEADYSPWGGRGVRYDSTTQLRIGATTNDVAGFELHGLLHDVRIWTRALLRHELAQETTGLSVDSTGLVLSVMAWEEALSPFNRLWDTSGAGHHIDIDGYSPCTKEVAPQCRCQDGFFGDSCTACDASSCEDGVCLDSSVGSGACFRVPPFAVLESGSSRNIAVIGSDTANGARIQSFLEFHGHAVDVSGLDGTGIGVTGVPGVPFGYDTIVLADGAEGIVEGDLSTGVTHAWLLYHLANSDVVVLTEGSGASWVTNTGTIFPSLQEAGSVVLSAAEAGAIEMASEWSVIAGPGSVGDTFPVLSRTVRVLDIEAVEEELTAAEELEAATSGSGAEEYLEVLASRSDGTPVIVGGRPKVADSQSHVIVIGTHWGQTTTSFEDGAFVEAQVILNAVQYSTCSDPNTRSVDRVCYDCPTVAWTPPELESWAFCFCPVGGSEVCHLSDVTFDEVALDISNRAGGPSYDGNADQVWRIPAGSGVGEARRVALSFTEFDLYNTGTTSFDRLLVYDGDESSRRLLASLTSPTYEPGNLPGAIVSSFGNGLTLRFISDNEGPKTGGFKARFIKVTDCIGHTDTSGSSGLIGDGSLGAGGVATEVAYNTNTECTWFVPPDPGFDSVRLFFTHFDLDANPGDDVVVYDEDGTELWDRTSWPGQDTVSSTPGNGLFVRWRSTKLSATTATGWSARFSGQDPICGLDLDGSSISAPGPHADWMTPTVSTGFTIEAWIWAPSSGGSATVGAFTSSGAGTGFGLSVSGTTVSLTLGGSCGASACTYGQSVTPDAWTHVRVSYDPPLQRVWWRRNGVFVLQGSVPALTGDPMNVVGSTVPLRITADGGLRLSNVRIWNTPYPITPITVQVQRYSPDLEAFYSAQYDALVWAVALNEGYSQRLSSGTVFADASRESRDGTFTRSGSPTWSTCERLPPLLSDGSAVASAAAYGTATFGCALEFSDPRLPGAGGAESSIRTTSDVEDSKWHHLPRVSAGAWIKLDSGASSQPTSDVGASIVGNLAEDGENMRGGWQLGVVTHGPSSTQTDVVFAVVVEDTSFIGEFEFAHPRARLLEDEWTHVLGTFDGRSVRLYVNGVLEAQRNFGGSVSVDYDGAGDFGVGLFRDADEIRPFVGQLAAVQVWDYALSADDALFYHNTYFALGDGAPVVDYPLERVRAQKLLGGSLEDWVADRGGRFFVDQESRDGIVADVGGYIATQRCTPSPPPAPSRATNWCSRAGACGGAGFGTCSSGADKSSVCECAEGFQKIGASCEDVNECLTDPCALIVGVKNCTNFDGGYYCECDDDLVGRPTRENGGTCDVVLPAAAPLDPLVFGEFQLEVTSFSFPVLLSVFSLIVLAVIGFCITVGHAGLDGATDEYLRWKQRPSGALVTVKGGASKVVRAGAKPKSPSSPDITSRPAAGSSSGAAKLLGHDHHAAVTSPDAHVAAAAATPSSSKPAAGGGGKKAKKSDANRPASMDPHARFLNYMTR